MQELEKILKEIKGLHGKVGSECTIEDRHAKRAWEHCLKRVEDIVCNHMNDGWIPVEEPPKKDYTAVFAVDKHDYYFVAVYDKEHGYRTNDVGADVDNIVAYCLFNPYRPERSDNHDGE